MTTLTLDCPVDQVFSQKFSLWEAVQQLAAQYTLTECSEATAMMAFLTGQRVSELKASCSKPKIFKEKLSAQRLTPREANKKEKIYRKFKGYEHLLWGLGVNGMFTLSAPRMEPVFQRIVDDNEPVDQEMFEALKKELVPAPQKKAKLNGTEWAASPGGGNRNLRVATQIPDSEDARWFDKKVQEKDGRMYAVFSEFRQTEYEMQELKDKLQQTEDELEEIKAVLAEEGVDAMTTDVRATEQTIASSSAIASDQLVTESPTVIAPVQLDETSGSDCPKLEPPHQHVTESPAAKLGSSVTVAPSAEQAFSPKPNLAPELLDVSPVIETAPKATKRYSQGFEVGQAVIINVIAQKSEPMKRFAQGHKLKVVKVHLTVEQGQRVNIEREDGQIFQSCFANWLEDDFSLEGRIEKKLRDSINPFDPYSHILQLAKGIKTLLCNIAESNSPAIDKLNAQLKSNESKLKGIAERENIWFDAKMLKVGKLIFVPNGKDFLADHAPAIVITNTLF